jgi:hypothetical protein
MADEMRLPIFIGDGFKYPHQHWFLCEDVWIIKQVTDEVVKRAQFITTLRDHSLSWYMKFASGSTQPNPLNDIKTILSAEFKKPKSCWVCVIFFACVCMWVRYILFLLFLADFAIFSRFVN